MSSVIKIMGQFPHREEYSVVTIPLLKIFMLLERLRVLPGQLDQQLVEPHVLVVADLPGGPLMAAPLVSGFTSVSSVTPSQLATQKSNSIIATLPQPM